MKSVVAMLAGAFFSASFIAPRPYWPSALAITAILVVLMRGLE